MTEERKTGSSVAAKVSFSQIIESTFIQEEGPEPSCILIKNTYKAWRVSCLGIVTFMEKKGSFINLLVDDGTAAFVVRIFGDKENKEISIGRTIIIIGKVRLFNQEKYLAPDIIKGTDPLWLKVRSLWLKTEKTTCFSESKNVAKNSAFIVESKIELKESASFEENTDNIKLPVEKIIDIIKKLDAGDGVRIEEIIEKVPGSEKIIEKLLESGDIFQIGPGKVKVL